MRYRLKCLTPLLVGDGRKLSPIDYMVWKDHVDVLDQWRIFRLLAKGPRLEGYLSQLKRADKLDFASWGGFAQNFAGRRIPSRGIEPHALGPRRRFFPHRDFAFPDLPAAHLHTPTARRRRLVARLEAKPARRGRWRPSRGEHSDVRRNGRTRHHV
jgi:hypothetical protein